MAEELSEQPLCFIIMPLNEEFRETYEDAIRPAVQTCRLTCKRADEELSAGGVFDQIRQDIENSTICIADVTGNNPNVAAEVGLAICADKPVIMITRDDFEDLPFDFRHYRVLRYQRGKEGYNRLRKALQTSLQATLGSRGSPVQLLKEMLVPASLGRERQRFVIAASPLPYRVARRTGGGYRTLKRTFADHVGVRGLIQAFGLIFGLNYLPDLLNPDDYDDLAVKNPRTPVNLYSIASPKANRWTGIMLTKLYEQWAPRLEFRADPNSDDLRDVRIMVELDGHFFTPPGYKEAPRTDWDFGLVIRAPHPCYPENMLIVLAGRSALGTQAACMAATDPDHIRRIKSLLQRHKVDLDDHKQAFWAVAHMAQGGESENREADLRSLDVPNAEPFRPK